MTACLRSCISASNPAKRILLAVLFYFLLCASVYAVCDFNTLEYRDELSRLDSVQKIDVTVLNQRKWAKNSFKIIKSKKENINEKYKKKFKASLKVKFHFGICTFEAKIRQSGDWKDHIIFRNGHVFQSLDVKLEDGNIANIVRFKLFLSHTRRGRNEILASLVLRKLGFLAPRTQMVNVSQNGHETLMMFQEKPVKEFLESNLRREGPVFEGDETLLWGFRDLKPLELETLLLTKLSSSKWAERGYSSLLMTAAAFSKLQAGYLDYSNSRRHDREYRALTVRGLDQSGNYDRYWRYETLLFAMGGTHALYLHNRKFYWNALSGHFEQIYYDGNISFEISIRDFREGDHLILAENVNAKLIDQLRKDISQMDQGEIADELARFSLRDKKQSEKFVAEIFAKLLVNLDELAERFKAVEATKPPSMSSPADAIEEFVGRYGEEFADSSLLTITDINPEDNTVSVACKINECPGDRSYEDIVYVMSAPEVLPGQHVKFLTSLMNPEQKIRKTHIRQLDLSLTHSSGAAAVFDEASNTIQLTQARSDDWFLFSDVTLKGNNFLLQAKPPPANIAAGSQRFNEYGLTGCLNFYRADFEAVNIKVTGGGCEDSLNIIESSGNIRLIEVSESFADAVDIDFSTVSVDEVIVKQAGNDCLDVSSGDYHVLSGKFSICGDKAVSIGEGTKFRAGEFKVNGAGIGVSVKDSSVAHIEAMSIANSPICFEAYNKKQEYFGGELNVGLQNCRPSQFRMDNHSAINVGSQGNVIQN